jgi:hypothetical protein
MKNSCLAGIILVVLFCHSCFSDNENDAKKADRSKFSPAAILPKSQPVKRIKGQVLYLPIYSAIPHNEGSGQYALSAFMAVHNTDFHNRITIKYVYYFDTEGNLVKDFTDAQSIAINPLATKHFFIPESDESGIGANFIIAWQSDSLVNEPLIESVMTGLSNGQGVSFSSSGKVLSEIVK